MKKIIVFCSAMLFVHLCSLAQFSFQVFPMAVHDGDCADTILNTSAILSKSGIRQINIYQTVPEITKTFADKTINLNNGRIEKVTVCSAINQNNNSCLCLNDTILYDSIGRITEVKTTDNKSNKYSPRYRKYTGTPGTDKSFVEQLPDDSLRIYHSYNTKGQLVNLRRVWKEREIENTLFYYNPDGLLDSTNNTTFGTFLFKRKKKGNDKVIEMTNTVASYRWVYNPAGQCMSSMYILKERSDLIRKPGYKGDLKTEFDYYYNLNGTLSKVVTKSFSMPDFTIYYSYLQ